MDLYDRITEAFQACQTPDGRVNALRLGEAALLIAPIYDRIFGSGLVANHLKDDIIGHASGLIGAARPRSKCEYVDELVPEMLREKPVEEVRGKWGEGLVELLWTKRALDFITRFLDYGMFKRLEKSLHECASTAYNEVLKPYHGLLVSTIVRLAFNLAPTRETFIGSLGFDTMEEVQARLEPFVAAIRPVIDHVHIILTQHGCDFPDKV